VEPTKNFFRISHKIIEQDRFWELSNGAKVLYLYLCKHRNRYQRSRDYFIRSYRQLINDTGLSHRTIVLASKELEAARLVWTITGKSKRTKWHVFDYEG